MGRRAIGELIEARFGVRLQERLIGKYLKRWGFTPQRPLKRALEQRPEAIKEWLTESDPALVARVKAEGGVICWGDETAVKEDGHWIGGYAPRGKTPGRAAAILRASWISWPLSLRGHPARSSW